MSYIFRIWCLLFGIVFLQACNLIENKPKRTIAFSQCVGDDAWRRTMLEEMKRELSFYPDIEFIYRNAENSSEKQLQQLRELIDLRPDIIIVSPNEAEPLTPLVDEIFRSGIPIVVTDRKTSSGLYHAYVGADNYEIGYMAGQYLANQLNYRGNISEVTGLPGSSATIERQKGFHTALQAYPDIETGEQINGQWLIEEAEAKAREKIRELLASDAIFAYNDQMALGVHRALEELAPNHKVKIIGVDALPGEDNGLQFVAQNILDASMLYPTGGKESIRTALAILSGKEYQRENILSTLVVDSSNVELMRLQTDKIISQQQDIDNQQQAFAEQRQLFSNQQRILNILVISLVLAVVFGGISFYSLKANWEKNKKLETQNREILVQQQQILAMTKQIEEATEAKINFFTNISHEFKTPLSLILIPLEDVIRNAKTLSSHDVHNALQLIRKNALILENLVSQLIDLRRVGYENLKLRAQKQNLLLFCNSIVQAFRPLARRKAISFRLENHAREPVLWFDRDLMEKVMYNLLSNAFKFTPEKGEITVKVVRSDTAPDVVQIQLTDNGHGISPHDIDHIFDPFYRGSDHTNGSGIGLALCKAIVDLHHGTIRIESEKDRGTTVYMSLPLQEDVLDADEKDFTPPIEEKESIPEINKLLELLENDAYEATEKISTDQPLGTYAVLLIDDHEGLLHFLSNKLSEYYTVCSASNAKEGLEQAYRQVPDLIISDVLMPGELGTDLVKKLKADVRTSHIPVILLTARDTEDQKLTGLNTLADAYITKPFNMDYLLAVIDNLIANRKSLRNHYSSELVELQAPAKISASEKQFLNELSAIVEENLANNQLNVDYICAQLSISRIQLYRKTKILLDCSVNDYIISKRLKKSKYLLLQDVPVNSVAYQCGFSSPAYFSTAFKSKYGFSPSSFKKNMVDNF